MVVSGAVTTTATLSCGVVLRAKSMLTSSSASCALANGCRRSTKNRFVEQCAQSAWPLDSMKLNGPCLAICGVSSRSVNVSSSTLGMPACDFHSSCINQQNARSLSVLPTGRKLACSRG